MNFGDCMESTWSPKSVIYRADIMNIGMNETKRVWKKTETYNWNEDINLTETRDRDVINED